MTSRPWSHADLGAEDQRRVAEKKDYREFLREPSLEAGLYVLPKGGTDTQTPHTEDELYYVVRGRSRFEVAGETTDVKAGSVLFVRKGVPHRFLDIREDLHLLVVFAPARKK